MHRALIKIKNFIYRVIDKKTVGVRVLLINGDKTLLVKHTYTPYWYMVGGGVDAGETGVEAIARELFEEVNIQHDKFELFGFYYNNKEHHDDYVALYVAHVDSERCEIDHKEIGEAKWFSFDDLPHDISPATKRRIEEYFGRKEKGDRW